jgi:immune inhibitor A
LKRALSVVVGAAVIAAVPATAATAAPADGAPAADPQVNRSHDLSSPLSDKQRALRQEAIEQVVAGEATPRGDNKVVEVAKGQYVELAQEDSDAIWTVLGQFSDIKHNEIPQPDRAVDNTTIWVQDFSKAHYDQMLTSSAAGVNSVPNFYEELSSNRYTVTGQVEDWVDVKGEGSSYGNNTSPGDKGAWLFVNDTLTAWYDKQLAGGKSAADIDAYLSQFDVWDRYDHDGDGNFDEADGYIDHFQAVHSGMGEEVGGGELGDDAIWSHRWYNQTNPIGTAGPTVDGEVNPLGGARVGQSKYWVGDYTVEPENGGVGVFAHEFGHDLGLPDLYDTSGNSGGAENSTGFWTLMSSGSYGNTGRPEDGIGTKPMHMGAWEKLQLGWLDYEAFAPGQSASVKLGPSTANTKQAQAVIAVLPQKKYTVTIGTPRTGDDFWYSGQGNDVDNNMLTALPEGAKQLSAYVKSNIERDWDYAYAVYSTDGGKTFTSLATNLSTTTNPNGQNFGNGITGNRSQWTELTADLTGVPAGALVGFRYWTDGATVGTGLSVDDVTIDTVPVTAWTLEGFTTTTGSIQKSAFNAYIAEYRQYRGYDATLQTGPYNFGDPSKSDWAERLPYQDGLLVTYWNAQYSDNSVGAHPGGGLILPVDAHPDLLLEPTDDPTGDDQNKGYAWRPRIQSYDSTFGLEKTDRITLHDPESGAAGTYGGLAAVPTFDDSKDYYVAAGEHPEANGWASVQVPNTGTKIRVVSTTQGGFMQVQVN